MGRRGGFHSNFPLLSCRLLALAPRSCLFKSPVGKAHILPAFRRDFLCCYYNEQHIQCQRGSAGGLLLDWYGLAQPGGVGTGAQHPHQCWEQEGDVAAVGPLPTPGDGCGGQTLPGFQGWPESGGSCPQMGPAWPCCCGASPPPRPHRDAGRAPAPLHRQHSWDWDSREELGFKGQTPIR